MLICERCLIPVLELNFFVFYKKWHKRDYESEYLAETEMNSHSMELEPDLIIPIDPIYIDTLRAILKKAELVMLIICSSCLVLLEPSYIQNDIGKWLYLVTKHGIWIYLTLYFVYALHFLERFRWHPWLFMEIAYFVLWALFFTTAAYSFFTHVDLAGAATTALALIAMCVYEWEAYNKHKVGHVGGYF